ncbi:MAG: efflux RND transporter permease subunit [Roseburia sp.]|uniref:efflux RND transporter permease subunit n=1 Tax=Roseburia sp. 831b TaxID=1261635 RepID=UPI0009527DAF|nr:MMPL family transporter [Roseburia sp. 831b]MCI5920129.1 efflux RND transporter permease subunit [Roseburia sp.]MDY5882158.1 efflux RND transporter permease subunit [Roseburia sp.]WVK73023.1 efflux RND transporter permease subunit [Roseburia sp. 831b]
MIKFGKGVVKFRVPILIISFLLLIPAALGYFKTRVNYDILTYLPKDIETMKGQDILLDQFGSGSFSFLVVEGMQEKDISAMREDIADVDHVKDCIWYDSLSDISIPMDMLPDEVYDFFNNDEADSTLMVVLYDSSMSSDETMNAVQEIRKVVDGKAFVSGMSAVVTDTKLLSDKEVPIYVLIAVVLAVIVLSLTMDSAVIPVFFLLSIGMAIVYNLGSNVFKGEISYVTQALAAVLQLGVTMDYSIFLWHSYEEQQERFPGDKERAMAHAISGTITSVVGSSITTVAGFVALCFMSFTLGLDLGIVMAKGVVLGVICCVTVLPSMILIFDKAIEKTRHKAIMPDLGKIAGWITNHYVVFIALFLLILGPAIYGYTHTDVYYDLAGTLPKTLDSQMANEKLDEQYDMGATHMILANSSLSAKDAKAMLDEINDVDGVKMALGFDSLVGPAIPKEFIPDNIKEIMISGDYQLMIVGSEYAVASDEVNNQCDEIKSIIKKYDPTAMLIGEAPCTKDLIEITDEDFARVSVVSIGAIFIIIAFVFKSISLPIILVSVIEFAIFINMGIPCYTKTTLPFIASIVIGTIQLGATVDYAILMTNRYKRARSRGAEKKEAITAALEGSIQSIIVSALSFFAATFGVGMYSNIDMISSLCSLMARGAIISMFVVIFILPSMFMVFDRVIRATSVGFKYKEGTATIPDAKSNK